MDRIEDCASFVMSKVAQAVSRRARDLLAPHDVTPAQYAVLKILAEENGKPLGEVSERLVLDAATVTGLADRLEAAGLVARHADTGDRRVSRLRLTTRARRLMPALDAAMDTLNAEVGARLGRESSRIFAALRRLTEGRGA